MATHNNENGRWSPLVTFSNSIRPGRIPRRQYEHQRRLRDDLASCGPLVLLWLLPVVGSVFGVLGIAFPRLLLSRQFYTVEMLRSYQQIEFKQRLKYYEPLISLQLSCETTSEDPTNLLGHLHEKGFSVESLRRDHLVVLALATGVVKLVDPLNVALMKVCPSFIVRRRLQTISKKIIQDDYLLLEEDHDKSKCSSLTDDEISAACSFRGLPTKEDMCINQLRTILVRYLEMIRYLDESDQVAHNIINYDTWESFVLHVPAVLSLMDREKITKRIK